MNYEFNIVYRTTNTINNKIYIGIHSTNNLNDGYLGSGKTILKSFKKYGKENFNREILYKCLTRESASIIERIIVDEDFVNRKDTYNLKTGGDNGGIYIPTKEDCVANSKSRKQYFIDNPEASKLHSKKLKQYFIDNPEASKLHSKKLKQYFIDNPEKREEMSKQKKQYYIDNPERREEVIDALKKYYTDNPEKLQEKSEQMKQYYIDNPEIKENRRKIMKNTPRSSCQYCGRQITIQNIKKHENACKPY